MTASEPELLVVRDLAKHFPVRAGLWGSKSNNAVKAVDGISFSIGTGETLALVGESGCGKTTTIKMILRLIKPTAGDIAFGGKDIWAMSGSEIREFRRSVQAVFQDPWASLNPHMRVRQIVGEPLVVLGGMTRGERDRRIDEVLDAVGLRPEHGGSYPHEFSGGQRQRIAIAAALVSKPRLMVLDEPVSALDVSIRAQIMNLFRDIQERFGVSYLVVAHDLGTTRFLSDEIAVMYLGNIVEQGSSDDVFETPQHPYTEALLSAALPAHPDAVHDEIILTGEPPSPINPPSGCVFHPRCHRKIGAICETHVPVTSVADSGHTFSCHLANAPTEIGTPARGRQATTQPLD